MSDIREELKESLKESLKNKEQAKISTIRLILAALKDKDIAARGKGHADGIEETEILSMLQSMIKQRKESAHVYREANRAELAEQEEKEISIIEGFLPKQMNEAELEAAIKDIVAETGASEIRDMGKVMGVLKTRFAGQVDMGKAGGMVKAVLAG